MSSVVVDAMSESQPLHSTLPIDSSQSHAGGSGGSGGKMESNQTNMDALQLPTSTSTRMSMTTPTHLPSTSSADTNTTATDVPIMEHWSLDDRGRKMEEAIQRMLVEEEKKQEKGTTPLSVGLDTYLYRSYRIVFLLDCSPSLLATLQPASGRILSHILGVSCRKAIQHLYHTAQNFQLSISLTIVACCTTGGTASSAAATSHSTNQFRVLIQNWNLSSTDPTDATNTAAKPPPPRTRSRTDSTPRPTVSDSHSRSRSVERTNGDASSRSSRSRQRSHIHSTSRSSSAHSAASSHQSDNESVSSASSTSSSNSTIHPRTLPTPLTLLMDQLSSGLDELENNWIEYKQMKQRESRRERKRKQQQVAQAIAEGKKIPALPKSPTQPPTSPTMDIRQMLLSGIFALSRMSTDAAPLLVLFTDGIITMPNIAHTDDIIYNTLLQQQIPLHVCQLMNSTPTTHLAQQVGGDSSLPFQVDRFAFGYVPDVDQLRSLALFTGGDIHDCDSLLSSSVTSPDALELDPFAPASYRPEPFKLTTKQTKKQLGRHRRGKRANNPLNQNDKLDGGMDSDEEEAAFLRSTQRVPFQSQRDDLSQLGVLPQTSPIHPDESGFEFESDTKKHRQRNLTPGLEEADEDGIEDDDEEEMEQIDDDEEDELTDEDGEVSPTSSSASSTSSSSASDSDESDVIIRSRSRSTKGGKQLNWVDDGLPSRSNLLSPPSSISASSTPRPDDLSDSALLGQSTSSLRSNSNKTTNNFFDSHPFVQALLLQFTPLTNQYLSVDSTINKLKYPSTFLPQYISNEQWQRIPPSEQQHAGFIHKTILYQDIQSQRQPMQLLTEQQRWTRLELISAAILSYRLTHINQLSAFITARLKEGFQYGHLVDSLDPLSIHAKHRLMLTLHMTWKEGVHLAYTIEWQHQVASDNDHGSMEFQYLITVYLISTGDFIRTFLRIGEKSPVPSLPVGSIKISHMTTPTRHPDIERMEQLFNLIKTTDVFILQLQHVTLTPNDQAQLIQDTNQISLVDPCKVFPVGTDWNVCTGAERFPHLTLKNQISVLPSSSYLTSTHPLWRKIANVPLMALRRWMNVAEPIDVICSLHRTYEINATSLTRKSDTVRTSSSDSHTSDDGGAFQNSENGVGTFVISWMELELELQSISQRKQEEARQANKKIQPPPTKKQIEEPVKPTPPPASKPTTKLTVSEPILSKEEESALDDEENEKSTTKPTVPIPTEPIEPSPTELVNSSAADAFASFSLPSRLTQQSIMSILTSLLSLCASVRLKEKQWLIFIPPSWINSNQSTPTTNLTDPTMPPFMLIRLKCTNPFLATIYLATFGCDPASRTAIIERFKEMIVNSYVMEQQPKEPIIEVPTNGNSTSLSTDAPVRTQTPTAQLHMFIPGTTGALPSTPHLHSQRPQTKVFPFGITHHSLSQALLTPHAIPPAVVPTATNSIESSASNGSSTRRNAPPSQHPSSTRSTSTRRPYMLSRSCHWQLSHSSTMSTALALLRKARLEEGFVIVQSSIGSMDTSTTFAREIKIEQTGWEKGTLTQDDSTPPASTVTHCILQYCVHQVNGVELETETWMESFHGYYNVPNLAATEQTILTVLDRAHGTSATGSSSASTASSSPRWFSSEELFDELCGWFHACDLHLLSIISTFDTVRDLEFSPGTNSYMNQPHLVRNRSMDSQISGDTSAGPSLDSKLGLELHLDRDFHADLSFNYRFDALRRNRLRRARLQELAAHREDKFNTDLIRSAQVEQSINRSVTPALVPLSHPLTRNSSSASNLPPPMALSRESSQQQLNRSLIHSHSGSFHAQTPQSDMYGTPSMTGMTGSQSLGALLDPTIGMSPMTLYSALLSPSVTPSDSNFNLFGLNQSTNSLRGSPSASPLVSPIMGPHRARTTQTPSFGSFVLPSPSMRATTPQTSNQHHRSITDLSLGGSHDTKSIQPSASQRWQSGEGDSKKNLRDTSTISLPSMQQELYNDSHGALVPLSLTYLLDCSASTPLYFPVPATTATDRSTHPVKDSPTTAGPFVVAPTIHNDLKSSNLSRSISMPEQLNENMKSMANETFTSNLASIPSGSSLNTMSPPLPNSANVSLVRLQWMLVSSVRRLSDLELISDRVFAQLVNEYTIILMILPGVHTRRRMIATGRRITRIGQGKTNKPTNNQSAESVTTTVGSISISDESNDSDDDDDDSPMDDEDDLSNPDEVLRDDVDWYLDCLLATRGYSPIELSHLWQQSQPSIAPNTTTTAPVQLPDLCAVLFECNRDEFGHPRSFPFPPPPSLPTFGSLPVVMPPANVLLPLFPPPGPANVDLALLADGRTQLLPHTYLFLRPRIMKLTLKQYRADQERASMRVVRKIPGMSRQSTKEKLTQSKAREKYIPKQRHQRLMTQQLMYINALRYLFSTPPISCVSKQLPSLPHATAMANVDHPIIDSTPKTTLASMSLPPLHKGKLSQLKKVDESVTTNLNLPSILPPLSLDHISGDELVAAVAALPSPSSSSPMFAAASYLLSYHGMILASHMRNYVRDVYQNLIEGMEVSQEDIKKAIQVCVPFAAEVNISLIQQTQEWKYMIMAGYQSNNVHSASTPKGHQHSGSSLPPQLSISPSISEISPSISSVDAPQLIKLADAHPLSRCSIVARLQEKFETLLSTSFAPIEVDDVKLYYFKPPPSQSITSNTLPPTSIMTMATLNPRPLSGGSNVLNATASNKLPPPLANNVPTGRPSLNKSVSAMSTIVPKPLSFAAVGSGVSILSAAGTTNGTGLNSSLFPFPSGSSMVSHKSSSLLSDHPPFFLQMECLIYVQSGTSTNFMANDSNTTLTSSINLGTGMNPPLSPVLSPNVSRPMSPARSNRHTPRLSSTTPLESPSITGSTSAHVRDGSFTFPKSLSTLSVGDYSTVSRGPITRQLSRQYSAMKPLILPISIQTSIADILVDIVAERIKHFLLPQSQQLQLPPIRAAIQNGSSVRTILRMKCLTLRPHTNRDRKTANNRDENYLPPRGDRTEDSFAVSGDVMATHIDDETEDIDAGEEERFCNDHAEGNPIITSSAAQATTTVSVHSNDYEGEHGIAADGTGVSTGASSTSSGPNGQLLRSLSTSSSAFSHPSPIHSREQTTAVDRIFSLTHLPAPLKLIMKSLSVTIESMVADEVLNTLLTFQPIQPETITIVKRQVQHLVNITGDAIKPDASTIKKTKDAPTHSELNYLPFVDADRPPISSTSISLLSIPLRFVPSEAERARSLFPTQLDHACILPATDKPHTHPASTRPTTSGLTFFPPPSQPTIYAKSVTLNHRPCYYFIDLLPDQQEPFHTLHHGNMNEMEVDISRKSSMAQMVNQRRTTRTSFDLNGEPTPYQPALDRVVSTKSEGDGPHPLPFWLLFELSSDSTSLNITFHHSFLTPQQIVYVLEQFHRTINQIVFRVNQLCLLHQLYTSRVCSDLLIPTELGENDLTPMSPTAVAPPSTNSTHFQTGDLACPKVLSILFPLHDRLNPSHALRHIGPMALYPFAIANQPNVFVYQEKATGAIYYLKLTPIENQASLVQNAHLSTSSNSSTTQTSQSVSRRQSMGGEDMQFSAGPSGNSTPSSNLSTISSTPTLLGANNALLLDVHGLSEPGEEITVQLHSSLVSKLSTFTLSLISQLLARNPLFKLTPADHKFIRTIDTPPAKVVAFPLMSVLQLAPRTDQYDPTSSSTAALVVRDPLLLLKYIKQNMERFFTSLCLSYTVDREKERQERESLAQKRRDAAWGVHASEEVTEIDIWNFIQEQKLLNPPPKERKNVPPPLLLYGDDTSELVDIKNTDYFFLYNNYSNPSPSYLNSELGKGLSAIYFSLGAPSGELPLKQIPSHAHLPGQSQPTNEYEYYKQLAKQTEQQQQLKSRNDFNKRPAYGPSASSPTINLPLPPMTSIELEPRIGGLSSVYDHVTAGSSTAEDENEEQFQLFDFMNQSLAREWRPPMNTSTSSTSSLVLPYWLVFEVWSQGGVNHEALFQRIQTIINQSLHEYWMQLPLKAMNNEAAPSSSHTRHSHPGLVQDRPQVPKQRHLPPHLRIR